MPSLRSVAIRLDFPTQFYDIRSVRKLLEENVWLQIPKLVRLGCYFVDRPLLSRIFRSKTTLRFEEDVRLAMK